MIRKVFRQGVKTVHLGNQLLLNQIVFGIFIFLQITVSMAESMPPDIHTVLPKDAIPAILKPKFVPVNVARVENASAMIGVVFGDEAHAYSAVLLNTHEIVNDVVGGKKIATTW